MSNIVDNELPLSSIPRLSPLNPRQDMESDVSTLAATINARGLLHPILVKPVSRDDGYFDYEVLAGGRRWRALRSLGPDDRIIPVRMFHGSDAEAREAALAEAVTQKPLHPVEEFEAFSDLEAAGFDVATIARDFALTERHVRQRLALGRLSPRVRDLWREGKISRDIAEAFTAGTIEAQEALLDSWGSAIHAAYAVRKALRREAVEAQEALAKFILGAPDRRASYEALGGRIEESLFSEETILLDRTIARNFVDGYLLQAAEEIASLEGWGRAEIAGGADPDPIDVDPDYTDKEERRLDAIKAQLREAHDPEDRAALEREEEEIDVRAFLRAVPKKQRAELGVRAELDWNGRLEIIRAVPQAGPEEQPEEEDEEESGAPTFSRTKDGEIVKTHERGEQSSPAIPPAPGGKETQEILRDALGAGLASATARNLNLALALAVAALGCSHGSVGVGLRTTFDEPPEPPRHDLLQRLAHSHFLTALAIVATAPLADLSAAFAELVGRAICFDDVKPAQMQNFASLAQVLGAAKTDVAEALDHKALFASLSREDALDAIRAIDGEAAAADAASLRKPKIVERAAILAKDRKWLPEALETLFAAEPNDTRSTAEAMVDAIEQDEEDKAETPTDEPKTNREKVEMFLALRCIRGADAGMTKASALGAAFDAFAAERGWAAISPNHLSKALGDNGVEKQRFGHGVHYLELELRDEPGEAQRAAE